MLEAISKFISTALFFLCTAIVTGLTPAEPAETVPTVQTIVENEEFSLVGEWQSGDKTLKFTDSGKLIIGNTILNYTQSGDSLTLRGKVNGVKQEYTVTLIPEGERVMSFNGITMYKIK